jgi:hypothetical protein
LFSCINLLQSSSDSRMQRMKAWKVTIGGIRFSPDKDGKDGQMIPMFFTSRRYLLSDCTLCSRRCHDPLPPLGIAIFHGFVYNKIDNGSVFIRVSFGTRIRPSSFLKRILIDRIRRRSARAELSWKTYSLIMYVQYSMKQKYIVCTND